MLTRTTSHWLARLVLAAALLLVARPASAQYGMDFSIYADIAWDGLTVYGWADGYDNSWGCQHSDYSPFGYLSTPTRLISGDNFLSLSFDDDEGDWGMEGGFTFMCSCIFNYTQVGNSKYSELRLVPTYVKRIGTQQYIQGPPAPWGFLVNREILDQFTRPINAIMPVNESFIFNPPTGDCTSDNVDENDGESNAGGIFGPDLYSLPGGAPNPCESSSLQYFDIEYKGVSYRIRTTYVITWRYSGVTIEPHDEP
jgi:hypothetical protein